MAQSFTSHKYYTKIIHYFTDVAKLLEETKVPELPDLDTLSAGPKKSVSFSAQVAKEFAITKMALVQPKSNMAGMYENESLFSKKVKNNTRFHNFGPTDHHEFSLHGFSNKIW